MDTLEIIRQIETDPGLKAQLRSVLLGDEILTLPALLAKNSADIAALTAAVTRNSEDIAALTAAVTRNSEDIEKNTADIAALTAAVETGFSSLRREVGQLSTVVGGTVEEDAASVVVTVLESKGWHFVTPPDSLEANGEIDVFARARDPRGHLVAVVVEAKTRLRPADVRRFAAALPGLIEAIGGVEDYVAYAYGLRVYTGSNEAAEESGIGVLSSDGERVGVEVRAA